MAEKSILLVDDEIVIRNSLTRELRDEQFSVTAVGSGEEAISALEKGQFDLVITDLMMSGTDGFGVLKAVKALTPLTKVIIITGYGDMGSAIDALRLGADDYTLKPCDVDELIFRIQRCFEKQSLQELLVSKNIQLEAEIDRRRSIEDQLRESDNRFRQALDVSSNGVWDRNLITGELYFGENWFRGLGYESENEGNEGPAFEDLLHPEDRDRVIALREDHVQGKTSLYEVEYRLRNQAGGWQWFLSRGQAVARDENGKALRIIGTVTDITRTKEVEAELIRYQSELEKRVEERTTELYESNIALKVVLKKREDDWNIIADQVVTNTTILVDPYLDRLQESRLTKQQQVLLDILRANINELTSPFADAFSSKLARLTPGEIQVANLVKMGRRTKEIAEIMHLSPGTISIHRKNIRKKLGLTHGKANLQTILSAQA